jgi:hypothetical protein
MRLPCACVLSHRGASVVEIVAHRRRAQEGSRPLPIDVGPAPYAAPMESDLDLSGIHMHLWVWIVYEGGGRGACPHR